MKQPSTTYKTLKYYARENWQHKWMFSCTVLSWIVGMLLQKLMLPLIAANAFNRIIDAQSVGGLEWNLLTKPILLFVLTAAVSQTLIDVGLVLLSKVETRVMPELHTRIFDRLTQYSMKFHNDAFAGGLVNQANRFVTGYVSITDTFVINITQLFVFVVFASAVLFYYSPLIGGVVFVWSVFFLAINIVLTRQRIPFSKARAAEDSKVTAYLADGISNVSTIKTFSSEAYETKQYRKAAQKRAHVGYVYWIRTIKNDAVFGILMSLLQVLVLIVSVFALKNGSIQIGTLILAQVYIAQIISFLWGLSNIAKNVEQSLSDAAEMTEILELVPDVRDPLKPERTRIHRGAIEFRDVSFGYNKSKKNNLFEHLSLRIKPGEKVGLVGHSGGGKTTITKLLLRFVDIEKGEISIDGQSISAVTQAELRKHIAFVPQEPMLFHRSLAENIGYGVSKATEAEVTAVAKMAHAHDFIQQLPEGYKTLVGERGVKLSGGQRQRIAIARAMLKNAPILVLDEATSALDSESEALIQDALWKLMEGRTAIVIAHRLSTIQQMDRIIVLDNGTIVEQGTHKELIRQKGVYADLWARQSGGFLEE